MLQWETLKFSWFELLLQEVYSKFFKVSFAFDLVDLERASVCVGCSMQKEFSRAQEEVDVGSSYDFSEYE